MSLCTRAHTQDDSAPIVIEERDAQDRPAIPLPPEGSVKLRNYRFVNDNLLAYIPIGDGLGSSAKGKLVSKFDVISTISPSRAKILELLRPEDPGTDALEAIVRPSPRRGLVRPYDEDTRRFLQRALLSPNFTAFSNAGQPETVSRLTTSIKDKQETINDKQSDESKEERSLADELREAEEDERSGANIRRDLLRELRRRGGGIREAMERDRLGKLALAVEEDEECEECGLTAVARQLDALLVESRSLHEELAGIHEDIQVLARRVACRDL